MHGAVDRITRDLAPRDGWSSRRWSRRRRWRRGHNSRRTVGGAGNWLLDEDKDELLRSTTPMAYTGADPLAPIRGTNRC